MTDEEILEKVMENSEVLNSLIDEKVKNEERKEALFAMLEAIGENYLMAPASSRDSYHNSFPGGLFDHSMNVYINLMTANKAFDLGFSEETMLVVSLLHDLGKAVCPNLVDPHYKVGEAWMKEKWGKGYEYDHENGYYTNRDRTMFVLQHFKIVLSHEEYQAVLLNDGPNMEANRAYAMKECSLAFWVQVSDNWAAKREKESI